MPIETLRDLYVEQLNELYAAEKHGLRALPELVEAASSPVLADAIEDLIQQKRQRLDRLEEIFEDSDIRPHARETRGMKGLLEDCLALSHNKKVEPHVRDAALIALAQHVEHDEIAGYGCARTWAQVLGEHDAAALLEKSLKDEKDADARLSKMARSINQEAMMAAFPE
ncbi:MAG: ferritin-like domain-containing protein [Phycisphaerales bacterium JB039]